MKLCIFVKAQQIGEVLQKYCDGAHLPQVNLDDLQDKIFVIYVCDKQYRGIDYSDVVGNSYEDIVNYYCKTFDHYPLLGGYVSEVKNIYYTLKQFLMETE